MEQLLETMRSLAVIPVATGVLRTELLQLRQERDEPFRSFAARVQGKAETREFTARCECGKNVDYTPHMARDVLLNGIVDPEIRREVLGTKDIIQTAVNDVISVVEAKEKARNALAASSLSAMSSFRRQSYSKPDGPTTTQHPTPSPADQAKEATCPNCKQRYKQFTEGPRGWNSKPHQVCLSCFRERRRVKRTRNSPQATSSAIHVSDESSPISQVSTIQSRPKRNKKRRRKFPKPANPHTLWHSIIISSPRSMATRATKEHPTIDITISSDNTSTDMPDKEARITAIADTGAQSDLWSLSQFLACGFSKDILTPVSMSLSAAQPLTHKHRRSFLCRTDESHPKRHNSMSLHGLCQQFRRYNVPLMRDTVQPGNLTRRLPHRLTEHKRTIVRLPSKDTLRPHRHHMLLPSARETPGTSNRAPL